MSILTETFEGVPGGMNLALPAQELDETEARYLQDVLLDYPGLTRRRGPLQQRGSAVTLPEKASGLFFTYDPLGTVRIAALTGTSSSGFLEAFSSDLTSKTQIPWGMNLPASPPSNPYSIVSVAPALKGGLLIGTSAKYDSSTSAQQLALWRGGTKTNYTTGTITVSRGGSTVTGAGTLWAANAVPGMFLFANTDDPYTDTYIGTVSAIVSDTQLTLEQVSPHPATARSYTLRSLRGIGARVVEGRITTNTGSATVTGGATKFKDQTLDTGVWQLYRASDFAYIGKVSSVTSNISITLTANAALALSNERFVAIKVDTYTNEHNVNNLQSTRKVGFLTAVFAERQWYANNGLALDKTSRVWFSDTNDLEAMDLSAFDGDFLSIGSSRGATEPIQALQAAYNALLIFKESETYAVFGTTPTTFQVRKIADDGVLSGGSVQPWSGGVIWAGREGIHFFDGINVTNLAQVKLGEYWKNSIRSFDPSKYRMWSTVVRDHYMLHVESIVPTVVPVKGNTASTITQLTFVINMNTRSFVTFRNVGFRGALQLPASVGGLSLMVVNGTGSAGDRGYITESSLFWDAEGRDTITCNGEAASGPDFFLESRKFSAGDSLRKKLFKQLAIYYLSQGGNLKLDTVTGLNDIGKTSLTVFPPTVLTWDQLAVLFSSWDALAQQYATWDALVQGVFKPKRVKFLKRSQHIAFRVWQEDALLERVRLGPYQVGYKLQRVGRI